MIVLVASPQSEKMSFLKINYTEVNEIEIVELFSDYENGKWKKN